MGGVQFRLGHGDHKVVEDFLSRRPPGVSAIVLDPKWARYQQGAAEAARSAGVAVHFDPATERMTHPGFTVPGAPYCTGRLHDPARLVHETDARARLVAAVLSAHPDTVTAITPPHYLVHDERSANLNLVLADDAVRASTTVPVRAVLLMTRTYGIKAAAQLAAQYAQVGVRDLELRLTPVGGEEESLAKVRSVFTIATAFTAAGLRVSLGHSGNIGHAAVALGHVEHYSVGVGLLEHVDHAGTLSSQTAPPRLAPAEGKDGGPRGALAGIYLPGLAATLPRAAGRALLSHTDTRLKVGCRTGTCATSVAGPAQDVRGHYLHARAAEMDQTLAQPSRWRATREIDRLRRAVQLREMINERYRMDGVPVLRTRTLRSLVDDIQHHQAALTA